jgi:DNA polymerase I
MTKQPTLKKVFFDFEFNSSNEKHLNLLCVSLSIDNGPIKSYWLQNEPETTKKLSDWMYSVRKKCVFVSYGVNAEARGMYSMGLNPHDFHYLDLYTMWRQCTHNNKECQYGTYFLSGTNMKRTSVPPSYHKELNKNKDNRQIGLGLVDCVAHELGVNLNVVYKNTMRDLILECRDSYSPEEQAGIIAYCESDIKYLPQILNSMTNRLQQYLYPYMRELTQEERVDKVEEIFIHHSRFCAATAIMESEGIPIDTEMLSNLMANHKEAKNKLIEDLNQTYPFFDCVRKHKTRLRTQYVDKYENFQKFVRDHALLNEDDWERTDSGQLKRDDEYLSQFDGIPEIAHYRQTRKILGQIKWLREDDKTTTNIWDSIGGDGRLRTFFGVFGTQTGRNAPAAKRFIFAMSAWLRCLVRARKGYSVTEVDFSSQEFYVAAVLANDSVMKEAYASGDPYIFFAKKVGMIPPEGTKKTHGAERELIKSTCLGVQYGMGVDNLQKKLTNDSGRLVTLKETQRLLGYHKKTFRKYWAWLDSIERQYASKKCLVLFDWWALLKDNESGLSVKNWPTQGTGGSILRECIVRAQKQGIKCIASLHDAIYIEHKSGDLETIEKLKRIMVETTSELLETEYQIRVEEETHDHEEIWVSKKGAKYYHILKEYLEPRESEQDILTKLKNTVLSS